METIIQQIALDLAKKITEKAISGGIFDIDSLASEALKECRASATAMIETISAEVNLQIREDKAGRKADGLVLKEKNRPRQLLTELGLLKVPRDYYYDKFNERYVSLLDHVTGIRAYERVGDNLSAQMVSLATDMSYGKSAAIASEGKVSRQTVKDHIQKLGSLEIQSENGEKKHTKELHVYADEDHVHMQRPGKERGKRTRIVPLVTVTEGTVSESSRRNRTVGTVHFVDEDFDTKKLWKSVEGYIGKAYSCERIEKIYIHGDGGKWISNGLDDFRQTVHVMDGYHLEKRLRDISKRFPGKNIKQRLDAAITKDDKKRADEILQSIYSYARDDKDSGFISEFGKYLMSHWEEIVNRRVLDIPGSCTEGQVSHILSERFSRDPIGWSDKGLGVLSKLRVYVKNGGEITGEEFKTKRDEKYCKYADEIITESISGAIDWRIFDGEPKIMDVASGTQILIRSYGSMHNILIN